MVERVVVLMVTGAVYRGVSSDRAARSCTPAALADAKAILAA